MKAHLLYPFSDEFLISEDISQFPVMFRRSGQFYMKPFRLENGGAFSKVVYLLLMKCSGCGDEIAFLKARADGCNHSERKWI